MTSSVNVSIEPLDEYHVQEISYDGIEKLIQPLSMSENLAKLAQKIDFTTSSIENGTTIKLEVDTEEDRQQIESDNKELAAFQASLWPWDSVRNKLRNALTEMSVLLDVITIAKNKKYLVLDVVSQEPQDYKPINALVAKKRALQSAALVLTSSAGRLSTAQNERTKSIDFHVELMNMRKKWRLKKVGSNILGDLSYRNAGSRYPHAGTFEVTKTETFDTNDSKQSPLKVVIPSDLEGLCYIHVGIQQGQENLSSVDLTIPTLQNTGMELSWQQKLENAQNVLFCKELFSHLAREAVQLQLPIPTLVIGNQIIATLFPGIQLTIGLCHSTTKNRRKVKEEGQEGEQEDKKPKIIGPKNHNHVLEHSLHQLLREIHHNALHHPLPHPVTATLGINRKRYFAGPEATDKQTLIESCKTETILEQIVAQSQHTVLRLRTMRVIDDLSAQLTDPMLVSHWSSVNSPFQTGVKLSIVSLGYDHFCRSRLTIQVGTRSLKVICRDGRKFNLSYEEKELSDLLWSQISQHQVFAVNSLAKILGWKILSYNTECGIGPLEAIGTASSLLICSSDGERQISVRHGPESGGHVSVSFPKDEQTLRPSSLVKDTKWHSVNPTFRKVNLDQLEGKGFVNKLDLLIASLTLTKLSA